MDIIREVDFRRAKLKRAAIGVSSLLAILLITLGVSQLKGALPGVEKSSLWIDTVKRGSMLRQVRGPGTLVPEDVSWIPATTDARVDRIVVLPGAVVKAATVILEMSNPEVELAAKDAELQLKASEAELRNLKVSLERQNIDEKTTAARVDSEHRQATLKADVDEELFRQGLLADLNVKLSRVTAEEATRRNELEGRRVASVADSVAAQLAVQDARVEQLRALARLKRSQVDALRVCAGIAGILQQVPVAVGQRVTPGTNLARVANQERLKAELKVPETQAKDLTIGMPATIDTRNGVVAGRVSRIDPAVVNGTVTVDVVPTEALPKGARPDLSVEGTVELERLPDALYVGRPSFGQDHSPVGLFRLTPDGREEARFRRWRSPRA